MSGLFSRLFSLPEDAPLSERERERWMHQIRDAHAVLTRQYSSSEKIIRDFYRRHEKILTEGGDEKQFFQDEILVIQSFIKKRQSLNSEKTESAKATTIKSIFDEYEQRVKKYPKIHLHKKAFPEIEHLQGALKQFLEGQWKGCKGLLENRQFNPRVAVIFSFDSGLRALAGHGQQPGVVFEKYAREIAYLDDDDAIQKAGQKTLRETFVLFNELRSHLNELVSYKALHKNPNSREAETVYKLLDFIKMLFHDFRLKGLL